MYRYMTIAMTCALLVAAALTCGGCGTSEGDEDVARGDAAADAAAPNDAGGDATVAPDVGVGDAVTPPQDVVNPPADVVTPPQDVVNPPADAVTPPQDVVAPQDVPKPPVGGNGCPATSGYGVTGAVRLGGLPGTGGYSAPCGDGPEKCGKAQLLVYVCATADCTAATDPILSYANPDAELVQASFDFEEFEFCGLEDGTYWLLPIIDHDHSGTFTDLDWTMGITDIDNPGIGSPARVEGHEVVISGADVELPKKHAGAGELSPVVINYMVHEHPSPEWQKEPYYLFLVARQASAFGSGMGIRVIDLETHDEVDFNPVSAGVTEAYPLVGFDGDAYGGFLHPRAYHDKTVFMETDTSGYFFTAKLANDPANFVTQGNAIDLRNLDLGADQLGQGVVVTVGAKTFLVMMVTADQPSNLLAVVDITGLDAGDVTEASATVYSKAQIPEWDKVSFASIQTHDGMIFLGESAYNSKAAEQAGGKHRMWALELGPNGEVTSDGMQMYDGEVASLAAECSAQPRGGRIWAGQYNGATHVLLGHLRQVAIWKFSGGIDSGERVFMGSGAFKTDLKMTEYTMGISDFRPSSDGTKLFVFGDCKSEYMYNPNPDGFGGGTTLSRHRIGVLDLETPDADGVPTKYIPWSDTTNIPDTVRKDSDSLNETLSEDYVPGLEFDSHNLIMDIWNVWGKDAMGAAPGAATQGRIMRGAVATDKHLYIIGAGSISYGNTGLTNSAEVMIQDLESGHEVLNGRYQWFYDGSSYSDPWFGFWGMQIGDLSDKIFSTGIYLLAK